MKFTLFIVSFFVYHIVCTNLMLAKNKSDFSKIENTMQILFFVFANICWGKNIDICYRACYDDIITAVLKKHKGEFENGKTSERKKQLRRTF